MSNEPSKASLEAFKRWQIAKKIAARYNDLKEWQRINQVTKVLDPFAGEKRLKKILRD